MKRSPAAQLLYNGSRQRLPNAKRLCGVLEHRHVNRVYIAGQPHHMTTSVIAAARNDAEQKSNDRKQKSLEPSTTHYCTVPRGRPGISDSAHSTAATARIRRLSAAAQIQKPLLRPESCRIAICIFSWPAALTLLGESSMPCEIST